MGKRWDLLGQKFGRLEVKEFVGVDKHSHALWNCICDCGNTKVAKGSSLKNGDTKSCGCLQKEQIRLLGKANSTHGQASHRTKEYRIWSNMKTRCYNTNNSAYKDYGGRGILVCDRWLHSFENFLEDMGKCPKGMSLDRKDNDGDYTPANCRWATQREQTANTRKSVWIIHNGETKTRTQWERYLGMVPGRLDNRLNALGWSIERALTVPVRKGLY